MKKFFIFFGFACFIFCAVFAAAQQYRIKYSYDDKDPLSLENAIRLALENDYNLLLTEQDVAISEQRLKESKLLYLPQVSLNAGATAYNLDYPTVLPENMGLRFISPEVNHDKDDLFMGVGVLATQYLYTGGRTSSTVSLAQAALKESMSRYEAVKYSIIYQVKQGFFEYLFLQRKQALSKEVLEKAKKLSSSKQAKSWEKILMRSELSSIESENNRVEQDLKSAHLKLLNTLNKELNSKITIAGDFDYKPVEVDLRKVTLWAMEFRPELKSALYKLEMDNIAVKLSLAKRYPDVILGAGYDRLGTNDLRDENMQLTLALKLPLGYDYATQLKQKRAEQRQTVLKRNAIEDSIRVQVTSAYDNLMFWQKETPSRLENWDQLNREMAGLDLSRLTREEGLKVLQSYYKAGVGYLDGVKQHMLAIAELELAVGQDLR